MRKPTNSVTPNLVEGPCDGADAGTWMLKRVQHDEDGREAGFTLVELMVVVVIIGLLATIVAINVLPSGDTARIQKAKADIATIEQGLEMYRLQMSNFPTTTQGLSALTAAPAGADAGRYQAGGYIKRLPDDPWGRPYLYASPGQHGAADVWTLGADGKEGGEGIDADIGSWQ